MAVAMPATTMAPCGPAVTMASTAASSDGEAPGPGGGELIMAGFRSSQPRFGRSVQRRGTQFIGLPRRNRGAAVAPGGADIGDHGGDLVVGERLRKRRHAVGHRIARGAR